MIICIGVGTILKLTKENFKIYAASNYDNTMCISEEEFEQDLKQLKTIQRMMSRYINGEESSIKLLVNNIIIFYNCFEHHAASKMIDHKIDRTQIKFFNAILKFLSLPMIHPHKEINTNFYSLIEQEFE